MISLERGSIRAAVDDPGVRSLPLHPEPEVGLSADEPEEAIAPFPRGRS
jgi:hypothetical protein